VSNRHRRLLGFLGAAAFVAIVAAAPPVVRSALFGAAVALVVGAFAYLALLADPR